MKAEEKKKHIWILIMIILLTLTILSGCVNIKCAYIPDEILSNGWYENLSLRNTGLHFLGMEKWCSSVYEYKGKYSSSLTVTTIKSLLLADEDEMNEKTQEIIENNFIENIQLNVSTKITGERTLYNSHKTKYIIYEGIDVIKKNKIKIIGEVWNCGVSGSSVICIGIAYISDEEKPLIYNIENWEKIIVDPIGSIENHTGENGLIYNINCH
jgi:hypothetical protein